MKFFLSRRWKPNKWPFFTLLGLELPLTIALLALFGIAAPNLYRTKLWQDGADNGFNSSPSAGLYAAANYRPYTTPKVWSQFITSYNVVIAVLSMFIMLVKSIMYMLHVFPPILAVAVHAVLIALYAVSVAYQTSSDTTDPRHPQHGAPWYITKSCSVTHDPNLVGYCRQAKASFACTCAMMGLFVVYFGLAAWSCFPSPQQRVEYEEHKRVQAEKWARFESIDAAGPADSRPAHPVPHTPGFQSGLNPVTPRTQAFHTLGGTQDLPLRHHVNRPPTASSSPPPPVALRGPALPRSPMTPGFIDRAVEAAARDPRPGQSPDQAGPAGGPNLYFPPPPKKSTK